MYILKKINRLLESRKILQLHFFIHKFFKEKDIGNLNFDFSNKPSREEIVQKIIDLKNYKRYLEIGCFKDELFSKIKCDIKIGVDPVSGGTIRETSDNFFNNYKGDKFDCIFIDGLHKYEQVKRDIFNSLKFLNINGIILLHDCLPSNVYEQAVPRCQHKWNGDVWKAIVELRTLSNYDTYTCYADHGIGVILNRQNKDRLNLNINNFKKLKFKDYFENTKKFMNIISFENLLKII